MIKKFLNNKFITFFAIPFFLLLIWFVLSIVFNSYGSISVLTYVMNSETGKIENKTKEIYKGQKVSGEFTARENNLGIISIRFNTFKRINDDQLLFRIKETGQRKWYYEGTYKVDQFQPDDFFTFGFPIIPTSKDKKYQFEIQSTKGRHGNAIAISKINPVFVTKYQFTKDLLLHDKQLLLSHIYKKFLNTFDSVDFILSSIIYLYPFIFYLLWLYPIKQYVYRYTAENRILKSDIQFYLSLFVITSSIFLYIIIVRDLSSALATLILISLWLVFSIRYRLDSSVTFLLALLYLSICPILLLFQNGAAAEKDILWVYYFLAIGVFQRLLEINTNTNKNSHNYLVFLRKILNK